jgi:hypothetical protein
VHDDDQIEDDSPAGRAPLVVRSRPWRYWRLTAILASLFILLGVYSIIATVVQLTPFHTANVAVACVQAVDSTVRLTAVTDRGQHVSVDPDSDVASDYRVGSGLRVFVTRHGHYVEDSGLWDSGTCQAG